MVYVQRARPRYCYLRTSVVGTVISSLTSESPLITKRADDTQEQKERRVSAVFPNGIKCQAAHLWDATQHPHLPRSVDHACRDVRPGLALLFR